MPSPFKVAPFVFAVVLALAACGGGSDTPTVASSDDAAAHGGGHSTSEQSAPAVDGAADVTVTAVDIDFQPAQLQLKAGEPVNVTIVNNGETLHDFTLEAADVHVNVEPGESETTALTIAEPGHYEAECTVPGHAEAGMTIDVVVA